MPSDESTMWISRASRGLLDCPSSSSDVSGTSGSEVEDCCGAGSDGGGVDGCPLATGVGEAIVPLLGGSPVALHLRPGTCLATNHKSSADVSSNPVNVKPHNGRDSFGEVVIFRDHFGDSAPKHVKASLMSRGSFDVLC